MTKILLLFLILLTASGIMAQDTLWVKQKEGKPYLLHKVKNGETLFLLSKKYAVPPAVLAALNNVNYQDGLPTGSKFRIPIDKYNFIRIESVVKSQPIYYHTGEEDDLYRISHMFNVSRSAIQRWNNMDVPDLETGKVLQVGWIAYDGTQVPFASEIQVNTVNNIPAETTTVQKTTAPTTIGRIITSDKSTPVKIDTLEETPAFERLYYQQAEGVVINEESGAAVFYPLKTQAEPGVYYAFHNTATRGSILKIMNPANGRIIYAKVIGMLPNLKEYHNAIVGLSNNAASVIGARDRRMFCKIKYR